MKNKISLSIVSLALSATMILASGCGTGKVNLSIDEKISKYMADTSVTSSFKDLKTDIGDNWNFVSPLNTDVTDAFLFRKNNETTHKDDYKLYICESGKALSFLSTETSSYNQVGIIAKKTLNVDGEYRNLYFSAKVIEDTVTAGVSYVYYIYDSLGNEIANAKEQIRVYDADSNDYKTGCFVLRSSDADFEDKYCKLDASGKYVASTEDEVMPKNFVSGCFEKAGKLYKLTSNKAYIMVYNGTDYTQIASIQEPQDNEIAPHYSNGERWAWGVLANGNVLVQTILPVTDGNYDYVDATGDKILVTHTVYSFEKSGTEYKVNAKVYDLPFVIKTDGNSLALKSGREQYTTATENVASICEIKEKGCSNVVLDVVLGNDLSVVTSFSNIIEHQKGELVQIASGKYYVEDDFGLGYVVDDAGTIINKFSADVFGRYEYDDKQFIVVNNKIYDIDRKEVCDLEDVKGLQVTSDLNSYSSGNKSYLILGNTICAYTETEADSEIKKQFNIIKSNGELDTDTLKDVKRCFTICGIDSIYATQNADDTYNLYNGTEKVLSALSSSPKVWFSGELGYNKVSSVLVSYKVTVDSSLITRYAIVSVG